MDMLDNTASEVSKDYLDMLNVNLLEYDAVSRAGRESLRAVRADGGQVTIPGVGSFINTADGRLVKASLSSSIPEKKNLSTSFNPLTLECHGCNIHHALQMWRPKASTEVEKLQGEAFLLTVQP
jgi:hypothetical protein